MKNIIITSALIIATSVSAAVVEMKTMKKTSFVLEREDKDSKEYKNVKMTTSESQVATLFKDDGTTEVLSDTSANPTSKTSSDENEMKFSFTGELKVGSLNIQSTESVEFMSKLDKQVRATAGYGQTLLYEALIRPLVLSDLKTYIADVNTEVSDTGIVTINVDEDLDASVKTRIFNSNGIKEIAVEENEMNKVLNPSIEKKAQLDAIFITTSSLLKGEFISDITINKIKNSPLKCTGKKNNVTCEYTTETVVSVEL